MTHRSPSRSLPSRPIALQRGLHAVLACACVVPAAAAPAPWLAQPVVPAAQQLFPQGAVRLLDGPFKEMQDVDHAYLIRLEPDRLLAQFRVEAGLEPKAPPYGGWESPAAPGTTRSLAGHSLGHYLSAISLMFRLTDDHRLRERVAYIAGEWKECQDKRGDGSLVAFPHLRELEADIRAGRVETIDNYWAPFYTIHKQLAGLRDAWTLCGDATAREVLVRLADWCGNLVRDLPAERRERLLRMEHGGMPEVLADVYAITGETRFLDYARMYSHRELLDPLAEGRDTLTGLHANTQVPKFIGFQRIHRLANDPRFGAAARSFWETVVRNRSWANGGNSIHEHFPEPAAMGRDLAHDGGPETCNTYNMLRLTAALYQEHPLPAHLDYCENALYNHILASQAPLPGAGAFVYYTPLRPDYARSYGTDFRSFWCCTGTGMENHARYGELVYSHDGAALAVNLFIPSTLDWPQRGLALRQETRFPDEPRTTLVVTAAPAGPLAIRIRHPQWLAAPELALTVNGEPAAAASTAGGFAEVKRNWKPGDRLEAALPMATRVVRQPQCEGWLSLFHGPVLLAGELGSEGLEQRDYIGPYTPVRAMRPLDRAPLLVAASDAEVLARIHPVPGRPGTFRTDGLAMPHDVTLAPFHRVHFQRYAIYWRLTDAARAAEQLRRVAEAERLERGLDARTLDRVRLGEQQPETDHRLQFELSHTGLGPDGRFFRAAAPGGWFSFVLKAPPAGTGAAIRLLHWGRDPGPEFELQLDGRPLAVVRRRGGGDEYLATEIPLDPAALAGRDTFVLRFQSQPGHGVPPVADLRVVAAE